jgi:xanthine/uracil permease
MASLRCTGNLQRWDVAMSEPVRSEPVQSEPVHPVDEILPLPELFALGLQHVLVMYANAVAVPLIIGGALHLPRIRWRC